MVLRANTYPSVAYFIDYADGVTLKSRTLKRFLKEKGITQREAAGVFGMTKRKFRFKLYRRRKFSQDEITALVYLLGAGVAVNVIWFPTIEEKRRIKDYVWEEQMSTYEFDGFYDTPSQIKKRRIEEQRKESGEDWEQSEEFEDYIFDIDELPSRRFMRRRSNGQW